MEMLDGYLREMLKKYNRATFLTLFLSYRYNNEKLLLMRKVILAIIIGSVAFSSCTKKSQTPDGPTDIRVRNITTSEFLNVVVNTGKETHSFGDIPSSSQSDYFRFEIAYPDAEITLTIAGEEYTTGVPDNTYAVPLQQGKFSYEVWISVPDQKKLDIRVIADAPLDK